MDEASVRAASDCSRQVGEVPPLAEAVADGLEEGQGVDVGIEVPFFHGCLALMASQTSRPRRRRAQASNRRRSRRSTMAR